MLAGFDCKIKLLTVPVFHYIYNNAWVCVHFPLVNASCRVAGGSRLCACTSVDLAPYAVSTGQSLHIPAEVHNHSIRAMLVGDQAVKSPSV